MAKDKKSSQGVALLLLLGIGSCVMLMPKRELTPAEAAAEKMLRAQIRCENETKSRLADTDGFEASDYSAWRVMPDEIGEGYTFQFKVKAKNGFGALIWADVMCHATYDGEYWTAEISQP